MIKEDIRLLEKEYLTDDVMSLKFEKPTDFSFEPGQYIALRMMKEGRTRMRQYSIASVDTDPYIEIIAKLVDGGLASDHFKSMEIGDSIPMRGPMGEFMLQDGKKHKFIAVGTGMVPFYSMVRKYVPLMKDKRFSLLAGYRYAKNILCDDVLKSLADENDNFDYSVTLTRDEWKGKKGRVQQHIEVDGDEVFYICGLKALVDDTVTLLKEKGVPQDRIVVEKYD